MVIRFECNHCHKKLGIADTGGGKMIKCPGCGETVRVPAQAPGGAMKAQKPAAPAAKPLPKPPPTPKRRPAEEDIVEVDPVDEPPRAAKARPSSRRHEEDEEDEEPRRPSRRTRGRRDEDEDEDEDEEPRRRSRRAKARRYEDEDEDEDEEDWDEDDEEKGFFSPNRIRGVVSLVFGFVMLAFGLFFPRLQEADVEWLKWGTVALGGLMLPVGIFYLVKG